MTARGFTLIELLVVIAIIGVLSSVVLASLSMARLKAADAQVRSEAAQLRTIMAFEYSDTGSYAAIKAGSGGGWLVAGGNCGTFTGTYASQGASVCRALLTATGSSCGGNCVYFAATNPDATDKFTILAYMPYESAKAGSARWLCYGSGGATSITNANGGAWSDPGCYGNP